MSGMHPYEWIQDLHNENIEVIYLSSTNTVNNVIQISRRTHYVLTRYTWFPCWFASNPQLTNRSVSILQSFNPDTFIKITGNTSMRFDIFETLEKFRAHNKHVRLTIVVNQLQRDSRHASSTSALYDIVDYVQLRKFYKYHDLLTQPNNQLGDYVYEFISIAHK